MNQYLILEVVDDDNYPLFFSHNSNGHGYVYLCSRRLLRIIINYQ